MCGICGYIGNNNAFDNVYIGILKLLNRGYDSVGITTITGNKLLTHKYANLENSTETIDIKLIKRRSDHTGFVGIAHSRWRVVGGLTDANAHPHHDTFNDFSIVHNGIIENYKELKNFLIKNNYLFKSETDSEVIANLISYNYNENGKNIVNAILSTLSSIEGTYALCIISANEPNKLFCARHGSPLLIGYSEDNSFAMVVSEKYGFNEKIKYSLCVDNHDLVVITKENDKINIESQKQKQYEIKPVTLLTEDLTCHPYPHWTLKEIYDQKNSCMRALSMGSRFYDDYSVKLGGLDTFSEQLKECNNVIFAGCGTSYHAGLYASTMFKKICNFNTVQVFDGAEMNKYDIPTIGKTCVIFISQSGETKDLHRCLEMCNTLSNVCTMGIINVVDSLIAREVDCGVYLNCGKENGVASTKAFSSQIIVLTLIALWFSEKHNKDKNLRYPIITLLKRLQFDIETVIETNLEVCKEIGKYLLNKNSMFVLGKGSNESIAKEGSLKIKELGYIHCEGYSSSALKHGPYTLIVDDTPVILLAPKDEHFVRIQGTCEELISRNATVIGISDENLSDNYTYKIKIPKNSFFEIIASIPLQLIGYFLATEKGHNPDFLRGLAKTVTTD
jgi:glucosamine--fructose-6-phosphate aminotransferase (isomerizing)